MVKEIEKKSKNSENDLTNQENKNKEMNNKDQLKEDYFKINSVQ